MRKIFALLGALVLAGCSTAAQVESKRINDTVAERNDARRACIEEMRQTPAAQALAGKLALTVEAKADTQKATPAEIADIKALLPYAARCREIDLAAARKVSPNTAAIFSASFSRLDNNMARLISRQVTWGEYNIERDIIVSERDSKLTAEMASIRRDLNASHQAEVQRLQSIIAASAANMPKQTNCTSFGGYINCTTY
jgi:hypothetical protein